MIFEGFCKKESSDEESKESKIQKLTEEELESIGGGMSSGFAPKNSDDFDGAVI